MSARGLISEIRLSGVKLWTENGRLYYSGPQDAIAPELVERMKRYKPELLRLLDQERRTLAKTNRRGLIIRWSKYPDWIALHDPTTGEWHEVRASECLPGVVNSANAHRKPSQDSDQKRGKRESVTQREQLR